MKKISMVVLCLLAAGCAERQIGEMDYSEKIALAGQLREKCTKEGFPPNSPRFMDCMTTEVQAENARRINYARWRQGAGMAFASGMGGISQGYYQAAQPSYSYSPPLTCTSSTLGAYTSNPTVNTSCY